MKLHYLKLQKPNFKINYIFINNLLIFMNNFGFLDYFYLKNFGLFNLYFNKSFLIISIKCNVIIPINLIKNYLINLNFKWNLFTNNFIFGKNKRIVIKGLGFKIDLYLLKNRILLNIKLGYSHRILLKIPISIIFNSTKNKTILLNNFEPYYLNFLLNLLFMIKKKNNYKQKGFFQVNLLFVFKIINKNN